MSVPSATRRGSTVFAALRSQRWAVAAVVAITGAIAATAPVASIASEGRIDAMDLMSDPAELTGEPWYLGAISSVTLLFWGAGAAVHLATAAGLRRSDKHLASALGGLGIVTVGIALDDLLLLHEIFIPWMLGLPEAVTFAVYALVLVALLTTFRAPLAAQPEALLLTGAILALAASVALDVAGWNIVGRREAEEVLKLLGAVAWASFPTTLVIRQLDHSGD